eukprot:CAMPEP_0178392578 /NCGR_PEP_ID=MMETSP0689_2-20121128/11750_1 /TAXON_ID=160604 /ORGANISM="Amphidinium massartii, Strain CS-259" /LENGTH=289 /DNA_ID=CAMNT_0020013155 /DNA_START=47 /DNA_END=916 /DNA_ORIENTATION=-
MTRWPGLHLRLFCSRSQGAANNTLPRLARHCSSSARCLVCLAIALAAVHLTSSTPLFTAAAGASHRWSSCRASNLSWGPEGKSPRSSAMPRRAAKAAPVRGKPAPKRKPGTLAGIEAEVAADIQPAKTSTSKEVVYDNDVVYLRMHTGKYLGDLDDDEDRFNYPVWVKARGDHKDDNHALIVEKEMRRQQSGPDADVIQSGDVVRFIMKTGAHMDVVGSGVRARYRDPQGQYQAITIIKQQGGPIRDGDEVFLRGFQGEYIHANPNTPDGEVKAQWKDEGKWQRIVIEK